MDLEADSPFTRTAQASLIVFVDLHDKAHSKCANNNQGKTGYYIENYSRRIILKIRPPYPSFSHGGCHTGFDILSQFLKHFLTSLNSNVSRPSVSWSQHVIIKKGVYYIVKIGHRQRHD